VGQMEHVIDVNQDVLVIFKTTRLDSWPDVKFSFSFSFS